MDNINNNIDTIKITSGNKGKSSIKELLIKIAENIMGKITNNNNNDNDSVLNNICIKLIAKNKQMSKLITIIEILKQKFNENNLLENLQYKYNIFNLNINQNEKQESNIECNIGIVFNNKNDLLNINNILESTIKEDNKRDDRLSNFKNKDKYTEDKKVLNNLELFC